MDTAQPTHTWHDDITINGQTYYTRHPAPKHWISSHQLIGLAPAQLDHMQALHEIAHAVAALAVGAHVHYAQLRSNELEAETHSAPVAMSGDVFACNFHTGEGFAVFLGAGERAEDHWLRTNNLWTQSRAAGVELGAYTDRRNVLSTNPHIGFGKDHNDYRVVHDLADQIVDQHWAAITGVADVLAARLHLTGDEIAELAQLPNGAHSNSCTGIPAA